MSIVSRCFLTGACLALTIMVGTACGRKTNPLTPDSPRPAAVTAVKAEVRDNLAYLSWPIPIRNIEGKEMKPSDVREFRVYRAAGAVGKRPRYRLYDVIQLAAPAPSEIRGNEIFWKDINLRYGQVYKYKIRAVSKRGGVGPFSAIAVITPLLSLAPPSGVAAKSGDNQVGVTWKAVTKRMDGSRYEGFIGYNVYRGTTARRYAQKPLNKEPLRKTVFSDTAAQNDTTYYYMVRTVDSPALPWKESVDSGEASATPRDRTPPGRPGGITVVPGVGRVFLTWSENKEKDIAGYYIYRSVKRGSGYKRLTDKPLKRTTFSDETVKSGTTYYYAISAVDKAGNEGRRSKSVNAYPEKLR